MEIKLRRQNPQATGFVTEPFYHFDIIMAPCARLQEIKNAPGSGLVAQLFTSEDLSL
jgi:hypothetical protein